MAVGDLSKTSRIFAIKSDYEEAFYATLLYTHKDYRYMMMRRIIVNERILVSSKSEMTHGPMKYQNETLTRIPIGSKHILCKEVHKPFWEFNGRLFLRYTPHQWVNSVETLPEVPRNTNEYINLHISKLFRDGLELTTYNGVIESYNQRTNLYAIKFSDNKKLNYSIEDVLDMINMS